VRFSGSGAHHNLSITLHWDRSGTNNSELENRCCCKSNLAEYLPCQSRSKLAPKKVEGKPKPAPFDYFDKGNIAVIGRAVPVANAFGVHLGGLPAWLVWAFVHLAYIIEFQNRVLIFVQWAIQDVTFNRGSRLITGLASTDLDFNHAVAPERTAGDAVAAKNNESAVA
jgi:hypothetical protein